MKRKCRACGCRAGMPPCQHAARGAAMQLQGIHHLTAISASPQANLQFYTGVMGMRLVKKTVNQGRHERLPPVLRRWPGQPGHRPHLLRLAPAAGTPRQRQRGHAPRCASPGRACWTGGPPTWRQPASPLRARGSRWNPPAPLLGPRGPAPRPGRRTVATAPPIPGPAAPFRQSAKSAAWGRSPQASPIWGRQKPSPPA